jgi:hypothetical protein
MAVASLSYGQLRELLGLAVPGTARYAEIEAELVARAEHERRRITYS